MLFLRLVFLLIDDHFQRSNKFKPGFRRVDYIIDMQMLGGAVRIGEFLTV
jgi:hypothetical protein